MPVSGLEQFIMSACSSQSMQSKENYGQYEDMIQLRKWIIFKCFILSRLSTMFILDFFYANSNHELKVYLDNKFIFLPLKNNMFEMSKQ